jgi:hypothetical protein
MQVFRQILDGVLLLTPYPLPESRVGRSDLPHLHHYLLRPLPSPLVWTVGPSRCPPASASALPYNAWYPAVQMSR